MIDGAESRTRLPVWFALFALFFFASCGGENPGEDCAPGCTGGRVCRDGTCVCTSHSSSGCHQDDVWWFDSCDQPEEMRTSCPYGCEEDICSDCVPDCSGIECGDDGCGTDCGPCTGGSVCQEGVCTCTSQSAAGCHQDDLWWFDSCGQPESLHTTCEFGCADDACLDCVPDCIGRECGPDPVCGENCAECPDDQVCQDGTCVPIQEDCQETGCPDGHQCNPDTGICEFVCLADTDCEDGLDCTRNICTPDFVCTTEYLSDCPWPAEQTINSENLTSIEGPVWDNDFYRDLSGAVWNPLTRTLWVCRNNGPSKVWAVVEDGAGSFDIAEKNGERGEWSDFGDLEGLTFADYAQDETLYLLIEGGGRIQEFDLSTYGTAARVNDWATTPQLGGDGAEGITFVPDEFLQAQGFVKEDGTPAVSTQGMGGLMFVGHQAGGHIYVFDLNQADSSYQYLGRFRTDRNETAGLEFDRSTGLLYILHGADHNVLEVARLSSQEVDGERKLDTIMVYTGPEVVPMFSDNYEGIAVVSNDDCTDGHRSFFLTIDGGNLWSLVHFREFPCE